MFYSKLVLLNFQACQFYPMGMLYYNIGDYASAKLSYDDKDDNIIAEYTSGGDIERYVTSECLYFLHNDDDHHHDDFNDHRHHHQHKHHHHHKMHCYLRRLKLIYSNHRIYRSC